MEIIDRPEIVTQQTIEGGRTRFVLKTDAANERFAERKCRVYLRREIDGIKSIDKTSSVKGESEEKQSRLEEYAPGILDQKNYTVDLVVTM